MRREIENSVWLFVVLFLSSRTAFGTLFRGKFLGFCFIGELTNNVEEVEISVWMRLSRVDENGFQ